MGNTPEYDGHKGTRWKTFRFQQAIIVDFVVKNPAGNGRTNIINTRLGDMFMKKNDSGIFCPACKMKNEVGAILCAYCHTPLEHNNQETVTLQKMRETTGTLPDFYDDVLDAPSYNTERFMDFEIPTKGITLIDLENGRPLATQENKAFILGRASAEIKTHEPLVDLTEFGALDYGISRLHAMIRKKQGGYQITDMESTNGTWVENQRLMPKKPASIQSGDRIRLGRLHILVFYLED